MVLLFTTMNETGRQALEQLLFPPRPAAPSPSPSPSPTHSLGTQWIYACLSTPYLWPSSNPLRWVNMDQGHTCWSAGEVSSWQGPCGHNATKMTTHMGTHMCTRMHLQASVHNLHFLSSHVVMIKLENSIALEWIQDPLAQRNLLNPWEAYLDFPFQKP